MKKLFAPMASVTGPPWQSLSIRNFDVRHRSDVIQLRFRDKDGAVNFTIEMPEEDWDLIFSTITEVNKHKTHELFPCYACDELPGSEPI